MTNESRAEQDEPEQTRGERRRQRGAFIAAVVLFAVGALYAALAVAVRIDSIFFPGNALSLPAGLARLPGLDAGPADNAPISDRINILILGLDRRPHHAEDIDGPPRSDSMYVLSIDPLTKTGGLLAIPRDLYVDIPNPQGRGDMWTTRINTAYHYGVYYKYSGGGPALAREAVEQTLKIKINHYLVIDWTTFANVVDELGGIELTVPATLTEVEAYNVRDGNSYNITIPAGRQSMDSITALAYSRHRGDEGGDLARIKRQEQVMQAAMDKALSLGWLSNAPALWSKFRGSVETDISTARLPGFIALGRQIGPERLVMTSLAGDHGEAVQEYRTPYGEDVLLPVWEKIAPIVQAIIWDRRLREDGAQVRVVNASPVRGNARRTALYLTRYGIAPSDITAADVESNERRPDTLIVDYSGKDYTALRLAEWLNLPRTAIQHLTGTLRNPGDPDIVVFAGPDLKLPADGVGGTTTSR